MHKPQSASGVGSQSSSLPNTIDANTLNTKKKFERASNSKSRNGCRTCKTRRLKCDELRPHCKRCIRFGTICDGYPTNATSLARPRRDIKPKGFELYIPPVWLISSTRRFTSDHESRFFKLYMQETAPQISGPFQTSLWVRLIPQACEAEYFIRQLVIAIAALSHVCTEEFSEHGDLWAANRHSTNSYALKQYDKALRGMRDAIFKGKYDLRNALLACLLVFCFESLHGDTKSTVNHVASGLALLQEWMAECLDAEILYAFAGLDVQGLFFMGALSAAQHLRFMEQFSDTTLEDVKAYWFLVQRRNYHFNIVAKDGLRNLNADDNRRTQERDHGLEKTEQWSMNNLHRPSIPRTNEIGTSALKAQMESCREDIRRWSRAAASVFTQIEISGTQEDKVLMQLLNIQAYLNHSGERKAAGGLFHFHCGIVCPLSFVGFRCRNSHMRSRAIALLNKSLLREGIWDSLIVGCLTSCVQKIEEEGMDPSGFIPENKRAVLTLCDVDLKNRIANLEFTRKGSNGKRGFRTETIDWRFGIEY
ncbi:hypothetical protein N431DRAFT_495541 [Stipitochalara longipes BDJ]|nr:hypothetical protein N431DRAFT_495541 [Stipitochalara longipes BDJ]